MSSNLTAPTSAHISAAEEAEEAWGKIKADRIMQEAGYDGCVGRNPISGTSDWVVFSPKHIKSIWNDGSWSDSADIFS